MSDHLNNAQIKSDEWIHSKTLTEYPAAVATDSTLTDVQKQNEYAWAAAHRNSGLFSDTSISFGASYGFLMKTDWKVRP
jgi:hypothetical protein